MVISTSEIKISVLVSAKHAKRAIAALEHVKNAGMDPYLNITVGHYNANTEHFKQLLDYSKDQNYKQGDRFGLIRFGSRVDLYVPKKFKILAKKGQAVTAGESLFAIIN